MTTRSFMLAAAVLLTLGTGATAHGPATSEPADGGIILDAPAFHAELRVVPGEVAVWLVGHDGHPIDPAGWTGQATLLGQTGRFDVTLAPGPADGAGGPALLARDDAIQATAGERGTLTLTSPEARSTDLRFVLP